MSLESYIYTHKNSFLKNRECTASKGSFMGQVYEASFYEWLKRSSRCSDFKLVAKHPYIKPKQIDTGFHADKTGGLVYCSRGIPLFEFDAINYSSNSIVFYECFLSKLFNVRKSHEKSCLRKISFLKRIFPEHDIKCTVVSDNDSTLQRFKELDKFDTIKHPLPEMDIIILAKNNKPKQISTSGSIVPPGVLNEQALDFDYVSHQLRFSKELYQGTSIGQIAMSIMSIGEVIKRVYLGKISAGDLREKINVNKFESIVVAIDFTLNSSPKLRYYTYNKDVTEVFIGAKKPKVLNHNKANRKELLKYWGNIKSMTLEKYQRVKSELST